MADLKIFKTRNAPNINAEADAIYAVQTSPESAVQLFITNSTGEPYEVAPEEIIDEKILAALADIPVFSNALVLESFAEDSEGQLTYKNQAISAQWAALEW